MKILAIDTSSDVASVALVYDEKVIAEFTLNYTKNHSQTIMPMVKNVFDFINVDIKDIDYIACSNGPGSFTGIRIGACTAKGLAQGLSKKIIPVPTLDAMAYNLYSIPKHKVIIPMLDARRNHIFTAIYKFENNNLIKKYDDMLISIDDLISLVEENSLNPIFIGDGVNIHMDKLKKYELASINNNFQRASSVAILALSLLQQGNVVDYNNFEINYLRKSQAERELEEKRKNQ